MQSGQRLQKLGEPILIKKQKIASAVEESLGGIEKHRELDQTITRAGEPDDRMVGEERRSRIGLDAGEKVRRKDFQ